MNKVKKLLLYAVLILLAVGTVLSLSTCQLWEMIFGPDPNNILSWWPNFKVGTKMIYDYSVKYSDSSKDYEDTLTIEITDIDKRSSKYVIEFEVTWKESNGSDTAYYIFDKNEGVFAVSEDETYDKDDDYIRLQTPVKEDNFWYNKASEDTNFKSTIKKVNSQKTLSFKTFNDVVEIEVTHPDWHYTSSYYEYYSPTGGLLGYEAKYDLNDYNTSGIMEVKLELEEIDKP